MLLYYRDCLLLIFSDVVMYVYVYICICMYVKSLSKWRRDVCLKGFRLKLSPLTYRQRLKKITLLTDSDSFLFNVVLFYNFFVFSQSTRRRPWAQSALNVPHTRKVLLCVLFFFLYCSCWCFCFLFFCVRFASLVVL